MKPYLVFAGDQYYPDGGAGDFVQGFETQEAAEAFLQRNQRARKDYDGTTDAIPYDWAHVVFFDGEKLVRLRGSDAGWSGHDFL